MVKSRAPGSPSLAGIGALPLALALLCALQLPAAAKSPLACVVKISSAAYHEPQTLRALLDCQNKKLGNAVASYGLYQDKINRNVPLGTFTDQTSASTTGDSLGLALRLGGDLKWGPVTTGPVAGLVLQRVTIKGFTESSTSGVSGLSYGEQKRDSAVSQLGWRVLADVGRFQPFAEAKWNHEFADPKRMVKAALTTITAPAYSMDAVPLTTDWGTALFGTSFKLTEQVLLKASFTTMFSNPNAVTYGGELGVNVSF